MYKGYVELEFKKIDTNVQDQIVIEGWASKSVVDRDGDLVVPTGIDLTNFKKNPVLLFNHNFEHPVGKVVEIEPSKDGLKVKAIVYKELDEKVFNAVKNGVLKTFSIGFRALDGEYDNENDVFIITKAELWEVSIVSVPANQDALFDVVQVCENGTCVLGKKGLKSLETKAIKNDVVSTKPWSEIDKTELRNKVAEKGPRYIKETYLVVPDIELKSTWKFPHHELQGNDLVLNRDGVIAAWAALQGARSRPNISPEQKLQAAKHLLKHYKTLKEKGYVKEIPSELSEMVKSLEKEVIKMYTEGKGVSDTAYTLENVVATVAKETGVTPKEVRLVLMFLNFALYKQDGSRTKFADRFKFSNDKIYEDLYNWLKQTKQEYKKDHEKIAFSENIRYLALSSIARASAWIYKNYVSKQSDIPDGEKLLTSRTFAESWFFNALGVTLDNLLKFKDVMKKIDEYKDVIDQYVRSQDYQPDNSNKEVDVEGLIDKSETSKSAEEVLKELWVKDPDEALKQFDAMSKFLNTELNKILKGEE